MMDAKSPDDHKFVNFVNFAQLLRFPRVPSSQNGVRQVVLTAGRHLKKHERLLNIAAEETDAPYNYCITENAIIPDTFPVHNVLPTSARHVLR